MPSYPYEVVVKRRTLADDGAGGDTVSWATVLGGYACRIYGASAGYRRDVPGEYSASTHKLMGGVEDLRAGDEIEHGAARYAVLGPTYPACAVRGSSAEHHIEVWLKAHA